MMTKEMTKEEIIKLLQEKEDAALKEIEKYQRLLMTATLIKRSWVKMIDIKTIEWVVYHSLLEEIEKYESK